MRKERERGEEDFGLATANISKLLMLSYKEYLPKDCQKTRSYYLIQNLSSSKVGSHPHPTPAKTGSNHHKVCSNTPTPRWFVSNLDKPVDGNSDVFKKEG